MGSGGSPSKLESESLSSSTVSLSNTTESGCQPLSIVVLGASGDLAKKETFPALFNLFRQGFLSPEEVYILGYARTQLSNDGLRDRIREHLKPTKADSTKDPTEVVSDFLNLVSYVAGAYDKEEGFLKLNEEIVKYEESKNGAEGPSRRLFYLALPPSVYRIVCKMIRHHCMNQRGGWTRVIVEKPFGKDLTSAEDLSEQLGELFSEEQIYRIDHCLGKELVQNLLEARCANRLFLPLWNRDNIDNVQIVFREDFGTEGRGGYFDEYMIIRDIIQNHLLQILCLISMEKPVSLYPEHIRNEKVKVLESVQPIRAENVVLGQYEGYTEDTNRGGNHPYIKGLAIATCCHHLCQWKSYVNKHFFINLGFTREEFCAVTWLTSWALDGQHCSDHSNGVKVGTNLNVCNTTEDAANVHDVGNIIRCLKPAERAVLGLKCKELLDTGRLIWLRELGLNAKLVNYVPAKVSPENRLLLASNG